MHEEAESVFASACKKTKGSFMKAQEMLMAHALNTRKVDLAVSILGATISESKNEELHPSPDTIIAFLKYFEDEKDVDGAENFCEILKRLGCLSCNEYYMLLKTYVALKGRLRVCLLLVAVTLTPVTRGIAESQTTANKIEGFSFEQRHGKQRIRVARVWRNNDGRHSVVEWNVGISLLSDCVNAYTRGDNSDLVATDTMKNTVYVKAKECKEELSVEEFAVRLAKHFTSLYQQVTTAIVKIVEKPWERAYVDGQPHEHGFKLGSEKHTTEVIFEKSGALRLTSGIEGLSLLKTTKSGFEGFIRDKYTALPDTRERILATEITASWKYQYESIFSIPQKPMYFTERYLSVKKALADTFYGPPKEGVYSPSVQSTLFHLAKTVLKGFPDIAAVQLKMPNIHFLPVNLSNKDNTIVKFEDDVYLPTDEPHGSIEATLSRFWSKM